MSGIIDYLKKNDLIDFSFQYYFISFIHFIGYYSIERTHNPWIILFFLFGVVPVLDMVLPVDERNPTESEYKKLIKQNRFKVPLYLAIITDWMLYIWIIKKLLTGNNTIMCNIGLFINLTVAEAVCINLSHELNHKTSLLSKFTGVTALIKNLNSHFIIDHNYYHHVWVSTPTDTATSKLNQSIFSFIYGSMIGSYCHSWELENKRCLETYGSKYNIHNFMIYSTLACVLFPFTGYYFYGIKGMILQIAVGLISSAILEIINYIEHYGLKRRFISPLGKYENVTIHHSWNAPFRVSNYLLLKLQRHSDHHENALKPYQVLASYSESPCLPQGYAVCLIIAVIPSIWFEVMNPLVELAAKKEKPSKELLDKVNAIIYRYVIYVLLVTFSLMSLSIYLDYDMIR